MMNLEKMKQKKRSKGSLKKGTACSDHHFLSNFSVAADAECICGGEHHTGDLD